MARMRSAGVATWLMLVAFGAVSAVAAGLPQGDTWASIARLPDWRGYWVIMDASAHQAGDESYAQDKGSVPLTPEYAQKRIAARDARKQENLTFCLPAGPSGVVEHAIMHQYLFTPGQITVIFEDGEIRRIFTDGRAHRPLDELHNSYMGDSVGHWEGATLVVDTIGFPHGSLFQNFGVEATLHTHLVERIHKTSDGNMAIDAVMTDPRIFTKPWIFTRTFHISPIPMDEPGCQKGDRDNGTSVDLTPPAKED